MSLIQLSTSWADSCVWYDNCERSMEKDVTDSTLESYLISTHYRQSNKLGLSAIWNVSVTSASSRSALYLSYVRLNISLTSQVEPTCPVLKLIAAIPTSTPGPVYDWRRL
jgi:hypothetical protein